MEHAPRTCAAGGVHALLARATLSLALTSLTLALTGSAGSAAPCPEGGAEVLAGERQPSTHAEALSPAAAARLARSRVDPRSSEVDLLNAQPDPDGHWLALRAARQRPYELALWFVDLDSGRFRPFEGGEPTPAPMAWREGRLVAEVRRAGRRQLVAIDPDSGAVEGLAPDEAPGQAWSGASITRRAGGRRVLTLEWLGSERSFELPDGPASEYRLVEEPGLVFFSQPDGASGLGPSAPAVRVLLHDMRTGLTREVATVAGADPRWVPSPDGRLVAITDDYRTRMVDPEDGATVFGPWSAGEVTWLGTGHGHALLTSGGYHHLLDVYTGRRVLLGADRGEAPEVSVLAGGGFLVRRGQQLDQLDDRGELLQRLVPTPAPVR